MHNKVTKEGKIKNLEALILCIKLSHQPFAKAKASLVKAENSDKCVAHCACSLV